MPSDDLRRLHPVSPLFRLTRGARIQAVIPLVAVAFQGFVGVMIVVVGVAILSGIAVVDWRRFTFGITGRSLVINEGVFTRKQRTLPIDRIQQVDLVTKLRHRLLGVAELRIDTAAGGSNVEASLAVLARAEAEQLRTELLTAPSTPTSSGSVLAEAAAPPPAPPPPMLTLNFGQLALAGVTGTQQLVMLAIIAATLELIEDLPWNPGDWFADAAVPSGAFIAVGIFLAVVGWFALAATASIVVYGGFTMALKDDDLHVRRGLLDQRRTTVPLRRVQTVRVRQTLLRRWLGLASMQIRTAGTPSSTDDSGITSVEIPILPVAHVDRMLRLLVPAAAPVPPFDPAPPAARRRAVFRRAGPVAVGAAIIAIATRPLGLLALALVPLAVWWGVRAWRGLGTAERGGVAYLRSGALWREIVIVPSSKVQSVRVASSPLQRRAGLATLKIDVAGRGDTPTGRDHGVARLEEIGALVLDDARAHEARLRTEVKEQREALLSSPA